ncbi:hypothetical protein [Cupriavidus plantarum]|uniref:Uncharacterized protein n=1 Tax=Cupriavidus plantarum TaxID=942865 RepID=A0A316EY56_9BURK|nr:hypothetical protein [Cupriavidus plantarum]PWK37657.1 hypothetical protein C7419_1011540 [Cupriavidus plantarum]
MPLFTTLTHERICQEIDGAAKQIILAAPGITLDTAQALVRATERLGRDAVQVVLDVSARVARLGYGQHAAVRSLEAAGVSLRHHEGLRIGVLICDDTGWTFATAPALVEADPTAVTDAFNAIALTETQVMILRSELPPVKNAGRVAQVDSGESSHRSGAEKAALEEVPTYSVVGMAVVQAPDVQRVTQALEIAPPQPFDLARQTQVYAALIQFVELSFEGFNVQSRRVQLPKSLPLIVSEDKEVKARLSASLKILDAVEKPKALRDVTERLEALRQAFLVPVGQAGRVMLKSKRTAFETELGAIEKDLEACKVTLIQQLEAALGTVKSALVPELARAVLKEPPPRFRGFYDQTDEAARTYVAEELDKTFPEADGLVQGMKIRKFY